MFLAVDKRAGANTIGAVDVLADHPSTDADMTETLDRTTETPSANEAQPAAPPRDQVDQSHVVMLTRLGVAALLLVAFAVRVWGISTGMPYAYLIDEGAYYVPQAIRMFTRGYDPGWFVNPPAFTYVLHAAFAVFSAGGRGMSEQFLRNPEPVWLLARTMSAALGVAAVGMIYLAGVRFHGRRAGFFAAGILAFGFLPVFYGHFALNDSPLLFPVCLALYGAARIADSGDRTSYLIAGLGVGLAAATKYSAGVVAVSVALAFLPRWRTDGAKNAAIVVAAAAAAFFIANPYSLLDSTAFLGGVSHQSEASSNAGGKVGQVGSGGIPYYLHALTWGVGWVPLITAFGGSLMLLVRDRKRALILVVPPILFLIFMSTYSRWFGRWAMPVVPYVALLAAVGAARLIDLLPRSNRVAAVAASSVAFVALCAQGFAMDVHLGNVLTKTDTRETARDWMRDHIPFGSRVVVEPGVVPQRWLGNSIETSRAFVYGESQAVLNKSWRIMSQGLAIQSSPERYAASLKPSLITKYRREGWCWVMTASTQRGRVERDPSASPAAYAYYQRLKRAATLEYTTSPWASRAQKVPFDYDTSFNYSDSRYVRPGPQVRIYHIKGGKCG